jgi:hypothetical protein
MGEDLSQPTYRAITEAEMRRVAEGALHHAEMVSQALAEATRIFDLFTNESSKLVATVKEHFPD